MARSGASSPAPRSPSGRGSRARSTSRRKRPRPERRRNERLALCSRAKPRDPSLDPLLRRDVRDLHEQPSGRLQRQCGADRRQQGCAAGAGGDGPDLRCHHRGHRSFGRRGIRFDQLPRLVDRGRDSSERHTWRSGCSPDWPRLWRDQRAHRHLRAPAADRRHHRQRRGVLRPCPSVAPGPGRRRLWAAGRCADRAYFWRLAREPGGAHRRRSPCLDPLQSIGDRPGGLCRRLLRERGLYVGRPGRCSKIFRLCAVRADGRARRPVSYLRHLFGRGLGRQRQHLHALLYRSSRARGRLALRRIGQRDRRDLRRAHVSHHRRSSVRLQSRPAVAATVPGSRAARRGLRRLGESVPGPQPAGAFPVSENAETGFTDALKRRIDPPVAIAFGCIILMLFLGSLYSRSFLSPEYLLQQLKVASFLGVIATGTMVVILLGQIDPSIRWVVAVGGMMSTAATGWGPVGEAIAIPFGVACGVALGLVNGFGVAYLRIPSMIVTLAVNAVAQGLMVAHTGGFSPRDSASQAMRYIATGDTVFGLPNALIVWAIVGVAASLILSRTTFGRAVYAIGNRERAAYLSGVAPQRVTLVAFAISGGLSAF